MTKITRTILMTAVAALLTAGSVTAAPYDLDASHSSVGFKVKHLVISKVTGAFGEFTAELDLDVQDMTKSSVKATIAVASIDTGNKDRDDHLRGADFFDVEQHPEMSFVSTGVTAREDGGYDLAGELTLHGVTKPVVLDLTFNGTVTDPWGNDRAGFSAEGKIDRSEFGLTWNKALETGGVVVGDEVEIEIELEAIKRK